MTLPLNYYDLIEALLEDGCPVCRLVQRAATSQLDGLLYEHANSPPVHRDFRAGRGLCNTHMWQLPTFRGVSLGVAILDAAILDEVLTTLDREAPDGEAGSSFSRFLRTRPAGVTALADALEPTGPCIVCRDTERAESRYLHTLAGHFKLFEAALRESDGLCLPHVRLLLRQPIQAETAASFTAIQRDIWQRLKHELEEFRRKSDINHSGEAMGDEGDSWVRAIGSIAGGRDALPDRSRI